MPPAHPTSQSPSTPVPELITYTLPAAEDGCYRPLRISSLPDTSFTASSQRDGHPAHAGRLNYISPGTDLQGWSPETEEYQTPASRPSYLQIDLQQPWNLTGIVVQGSGASAAFITSFLVQFSMDQSNWHAYQELNGDQELQPKVFTGNLDGSTPVARSFEKMVRARYVRIVPQTFHSGIFLRTELLGCGEVPKDSPFSPTKQKPPEELCQPGQFQCHNGHCVPAGTFGVVCNGVNDCGDQSDEIYCGTAPSPLSPARWGCQRSQFYCKASGVCIEVSQRCDGLPDCSDAADERGCVAGITYTTPTIVSFSVNQEISPRVRPPGAETPAQPHAPTSHPVPLSPLTKPVPPRTDRSKTPGDFAPAGPCDGSLGLEDGRIHYQQLTASSSKENNPPDAGRLNIVPNILNIGPGWSPLSTDKQPYFQVDFLQPMFISGIIVQGGRQSGGFVTKFRLLYSNDGLAFNNYTRGERGATAKSEVFEGNSDSNTPVRKDLARPVLARFLRLLPVAYNKAIYLRSEILGCPHVQPTSSPGHEMGTRPSSMVTVPGASQPSRCRNGEFECHSGECVNASSALCDGRYDCLDYSDEEGCGEGALKLCTLYKGLH
uniref:F5/8 type C domain-containing protein n=1 Tax=Leptobrachium leishanense TaxID=445787 RepID=A0A8C5PHX3_9ANUR